MKGLHWGALAALMAASVAGAALANDSTAALGAGGLVLTGSADIRMASEDLYISRRKIRVRYEFLNESAEPVTTRVAFPLPEADFGALMDSDVGWPSDDPKNPVGFTVTVGGKAVTPELEQKAFYRGEDVTALLRRLGVPFDHRGYHLGEALKALPDAAKKELTDRGLADISADYATAMWTLKSTFHWEQTFPPGRPVAVAHEYRPVAGAAFTNSEMFAGDMQSHAKDYCIDDATRIGIARRLNDEKARTGGDGLMMLWFVDYVLSTGRNWKGPIGDFRLTLDKGRTDNLISLCIDGVRKTGPTTFVVERKDFEPEGDLRVMFIERPEG